MNSIENRQCSKVHELSFCVFLYNQLWSWVLPVHMQLSSFALYYFRILVDKYIESAEWCEFDLINCTIWKGLILLQLKSIRVCGPRYWPQVIKLTPEGILLILNISHFSSEFFFIIFLSWLSNRQAMVEIRRQDRSLQRGRTLHKAKSWIMLLLWWSNWLPVFDFAGNAWG